MVAFSEIDHRNQTYHRIDPMASGTIDSPWFSAMYSQMAVIYQVILSTRLIDEHISKKNFSKNHVGTLELEVFSYNVIITFFPIFPNFSNFRNIGKH